MKLTKTAIAGMEYEGDGRSRDIRWDTDSREAVTGFGVRVYPSGLKSFVVSYRFHGRKQLMVLGQFSRMSLAEARKQAKLVFADIVANRNPLEKRKRERAAGTVSELCERYIKDCASKKKSGHKDESQIRRRILPELGTLKVKDVCQDDILALHEKVGCKAPYEANRLLSLLSNMFNLARQWKFIPKEELAQFDNPCKDVKRFKEQERFQFVKEAELPALMAAIDAEENPYIRAAFKLLLLTGLRKSELLGAKWSDIEGNNLHLPDTKADEPQRIILSTVVLEILNDLPRLNDYLLPGRQGKGHLVNIDKSWYRIRERAGLPHIRIHDLRRTAGSWMYMSGVPLGEIGAVLRHKNASTTEIYARFLSDKTKTTMERHAEKISRVSKGETADVVDIAGGKS